MHKLPAMKIQNSNSISAFGGINFVLEHLEETKVGDLLDQHLPNLAAQSDYKWRDIVYSLLSIYLCGGDHIEDLQTHLRPHFKNNPFVKLPSSDTIAKRLKELSENSKKTRT